MDTPKVDDGLQYYVFMPWLGTLYGNRDKPLKWLRVTPYGSTGNKILTTQLTRTETVAGQRETTVTDVITTVDLKQFLTRMTYGDTTYLEVGLTRLDGNNGLSEIYNAPEPFMTQAVLRNYEARSKALLEIADSKKRTIIRDKRNNKALQEELEGIATMWEQVMNYGRIYPYNCVGAPSSISFNRSIPGNLAEIHSKFDELSARMYYSRHFDMPYKIESYQREKLLSMYGIRE